MRVATHLFQRKFLNFAKEMKSLGWTLLLTIFYIHITWGQASGRGLYLILFLCPRLYSLGHARLGAREIMSFSYLVHNHAVELFKVLQIYHRFQRLWRSTRTTITDCPNHKLQTYLKNPSKSVYRYTDNV